MPHIRSRTHQNGKLESFGRLASTHPDHNQVTHARSGGIYEIMGLMQGKVVGDSLVIMDAFALPVQGTETRVNAANEANEFMVQFLDGGSKVRDLASELSFFISVG